MKPFNSIGQAEADIAHYTVMNKPLSGYVATSAHGGEDVHRLEYQWAKTFKVEHAVACNSGTSGLLAACMAIGIEVGDEVIVSPYTMSATAAAPKLLGAKLVWCDIDPYTYTMDPKLVEGLITNNTMAIIVTNLFGQPAHLKRLASICDKHDIYLIEDNAQAIFASEYDKLCGTVGQFGVFSLNVHKHLQTGEGGVVVCHNVQNDKRLREAINHGEVRGGLLGLNLRMTEVTAAMAMVQLSKAKAIMKGRLAFAMALEAAVVDAKLPLTIPFARPDCGHAYYCWAAQLKEPCNKTLPLPWRRGYMKPLYRLPALETEPVCCPVVERIEDKMVLMEICSIDPTPDEIRDMVRRLGEVL